MEKVPELLAKGTCSSGPRSRLPSPVILRGRCWLTCALPHPPGQRLLRAGVLNPSVSPADILAQRGGSGKAVKTWRGLARTSLRTMLRREASGPAVVPGRLEETAPRLEAEVLCHGPAS